MDLNTFESEGNPIIVARGRDYFRNGNISPLEEIAPELFHGTANGTALYEVDIRMKGDRVVSTACSCPYDGGPRCKHVYGALFQLREQRKSIEGQANEGEGSENRQCFPRETYEAVLSYLESHPRQTEAQPPKRKKRQRTVDPFTPSQALRVIEGPLSEFELNWDYGGPWYSYSYNGEALEGVLEVLENARKTHAVFDGVILNLMALRAAFQFMTSHDDSDGIAGDVVDRCFETLDQCISDLAAASLPGELSLAMQLLIACAQDPVFEGWNNELQFLLLAEECVLGTDSARTLLRAVVQCEETSRYDAASFVPLHYRLLERVGPKKDVRAYAKRHELHPYFFDLKIEEAFLGHDMESVAALARTRIERDRASRKHQARAGSVGYSYPFYPRGIKGRQAFPHGYETYLEAALQELGDREGLIELYRSRIVDNDRDCGGALSILKTLAGSDWPHERDVLIAQLLEKRWSSTILEQIVREDHLVDVALSYCKKDGGRFLRLYRLVAEGYPDEAEAMFLEKIRHDARPSGNRESYGELCKVIQKYQSVCGTGKAKEIVAELRGAYPRRRTMLELLDNLEMSWA